jgi:hypothetical protein
MMKRLGPQPTENHCQLFEHFAVKCRVAIAGVEKRRNTAVADLLEIRREISS